jgi:hypothetical protein
MVDDINTGSACAAEKCTHHSHSCLLDDADAAAEAKERALLAEVAAARAEREAAIAESHELRTHLLSLYNCAKHLAPYPPEVAEGVVAVMDAVRAALAAAPPRVTAEDYDSRHLHSAGAQNAGGVCLCDECLDAPPPPSTCPHCHESPVYCLVCGRDASAPPREERLAALGYEKPPPGSGTVGEVIGLRPTCRNCEDGGHPDFCGCGGAHE